ncbi:nucleotidyltransferase, partial [Candidatus Roizmanbacteria bacterium RIFCSPHIGHO2_01_FULL_39_12b]
MERDLAIIDKNFELLKKSYNVKKIGIFGSVAKNEQNKNSDVDILVDFFKPVDFFDFLNVEDYLSKILKRKVDLTTKNALKPMI